MDNEVSGLAGKKLLDRSVRRCQKLETDQEKPSATTLNLQGLEISEGDGTLSAETANLGRQFGKTAGRLLKKLPTPSHYSLSETITTLDSEKTSVRRPHVSTGLLSWMHSNGLLTTLNLSANATGYSKNDGWPHHQRDPPRPIQYHRSSSTLIRSPVHLPRSPAQRL